MINLNLTNLFWLKYKKLKVTKISKTCQTFIDYIIEFTVTFRPHILDGKLAHLFDIYITEYSELLIFIFIQNFK